RMFSEVRESAQTFLERRCQIDSDRILSTDFSELLRRGDANKSLRYFEGNVHMALRSLRKEPSPRLFVFINAHGSDDSFGARETREQWTYLHSAVADAIFDEIDAFEKETGKPVSLEVLVDTCSSESFVTALKVRTSDGRGPYQDHGGRR